MTLLSLRERLALVLLTLLPFHAFGVTFLTRMLAGPGHAPLPELLLWKEALLAVIVAVALVELLAKRLRHRFWIEFDSLDGIIVLLCILASLIGLRFDAFLAPRFLYGVRYDLFLPLCFMVLRRVPWSPSFMTLALRNLVAAGAVVALAGIAFLLLPVETLQLLGYSDMHSLYRSGGPLAPFQLIGETGIRRMQSVMSGPNQLGLWLLLPYASALATVLGAHVQNVRELLQRVQARPWYAVAFVLMDLAICLTFSRAAWIAAVVVMFFVLSYACTRRFFTTMVVTVCVPLAVAVFGMFLLVPQVLLRATSNAHHIQKPLEAVRLIRQHPLGLGLGTAGPATNRVSDTCVELPAGADVSWAAAHPDLCVLVDGFQVLPKDRTCACPVLPENWYLQIGVELGIIGLALYVALVILLLWRASSTREKSSHHPVIAAFVGVAIAGLFLHSFEDFGLSATLWLLLAVIL